MIVRTAVAIGVAVLWAASYVVAVAQHDYTGFSVSTPVMVMVGVWLWQGRMNGNDRRP